MKSNLATNFGSGADAFFNDENIFVNVANSLVQGNATAAAKFNTLAAGLPLEQKIASLYATIIPPAKQTAEGLAFLTRPDGLKFYQDVAKERGITAENGPAVVALASLLKVVVDGKIGVGNPVSDLIASIADGSSTLPVTSATMLPIETVDGTRFDADDAPDARPGFAGPPPASLLGSRHRPVGILPFFKVLSRSTPAKVEARPGLVICFETAERLAALQVTAMLHRHIAPKGMDPRQDRRRDRTGRPCRMVGATRCPSC